MTNEPSNSTCRKLELQRSRRAKCRRIDFAADPDVDAIINRLRSGHVSGTASAIINRAVREWAQGSGMIRSSMRASEDAAPSE